MATANSVEQVQRLLAGAKLRFRPPAALAPPVRPPCRKRVLLLAEHHLIRSGVSMFLERRGLEVAVACDGATAIGMAATEPPHAAVLDYSLGLPETLGVADLLAAMSVPFLFFTGPLVEAGWGAHEKAVRLKKPCTPDMLAAAVGNLLGMTALRPCREPRGPSRGTVRMG